MLIRFKSFGPLRRLIRVPQVVIEVADNCRVIDVLQAVADMYGSAAQSLIFDNGKVSGNLIIMLNMKDINTLERFQTPIHPNDEITVLPHVQGG